MVNFEFHVLNNTDKIKISYIYICNKISNNMDFDFGNLVYIILMLIFILVGASSKKKRKPVSTPAGDPAEGESEQPVSTAETLNENLKKLFGDYMDIQTAEEPEKVVEEEDDYFSRKQKEYMPKYDETRMDKEVSEIERVGSEEGIGSVFHMTDLLDENLFGNMEMMGHKTQKTPPFTQSIREDFDPRKAILYTALFNPKYF